MTEQLNLSDEPTAFETWVRNVLIEYPTSESDLLSDFSIMRHGQGLWELTDVLAADVLAAIARLVELGEVAIDGGVIRRIHDGNV